MTLPELSLSRPPVTQVESGLLGRLALAQTAPALLAFAVVFVLGADSGGYRATTWGWSTLVLSLVGALALVLHSEPRVGRLEKVVALALLAFTAWGLLSALWAPRLP